MHSLLSGDILIPGEITLYYITLLFFLYILFVVVLFLFTLVVLFNISSRFVVFLLFFGVASLLFIVNSGTPAVFSGGGFGRTSWDFKDCYWLGSPCPIPHHFQCFVGFNRLIYAVYAYIYLG